MSEAISILNWFNKLGFDMQIIIAIIFIALILTKVSAKKVHR